MDEPRLKQPVVTESRWATTIGVLAIAYPAALFLARAIDLSLSSNLSFAALFPWSFIGIVAGGILHLVGGVELLRRQTRGRLLLLTASTLPVAALFIQFLTLRAYLPIDPLARAATTLINFSVGGITEGIFILPLYLLANTCFIALTLNREPRVAQGMDLPVIVRLSGLKFRWPQRCVGCDCANGLTTWSNSLEAKTNAVTTYWHPSMKREEWKELTVSHTVPICSRCKAEQASKDLTAASVVPFVLIVALLQMVVLAFWLDGDRGVAIRVIFSISWTSYILYLPLLLYLAFLFLEKSEISKNLRKVELKSRQSAPPPLEFEIPRFESPLHLDEAYIEQAISFANAEYARRFVESNGGIFPAQSRSEDRLRRKKVSATAQGKEPAVPAFTWIRANFQTLTLKSFGRFLKDEAFVFFVLIIASAVFVLPIVWFVTVVIIDVDFSDRTTAVVIAATLLTLPFIKLGLGVWEYLMGDHESQLLADISSASGTQSPSTGPDTLHPLFAELAEIGSAPNNPEGVADEIYFWRPIGEGVGPDKLWDARTRTIGKALYEEGSLELMLRAHAYVVERLGDLAGHALSAHWHRIGENSESGETWMH